MLKAALRNLRFHFSILLLPTFFFALSISPNLNQSKLLWMMVIIHLSLYPALYGFKYYYQIRALLNKDDLYSKTLLNISLLLALIAESFAASVNLTFFVLVSIYGVASIFVDQFLVRRKVFIGNWLFNVLLNGFLGACIAFVGINAFSFENIFSGKVLFVAVLSGLLLGVNYPIEMHSKQTVVNDQVKKTFYYKAIFLLLSIVGFVFFLNEFYDGQYILLFVGAQTPIALFLLIKILSTKRKSETENYRSPRWIDYIHAIILISFFIYFFLDSTNVINIFVQ